jgi:hypothetical protein
VPVRKFRTFEEARQDLWLPSGHPDLLVRMARLSQLARATKCRQGVFRFRTIEEAKADKRKPRER